ncbi:MAG: amidohydrolase family protein [Bacteroidetes bacterium]|jgi:imidazolonepropionase-like amidohydrolase|nr:amidohydrolase family protein [Bacteroidota bacterium]
MNRLLCLSCALALFLISLLPVLPARSQPLAVQNVTVVDVTDGTLRPNQTILINGSRIAAVGSADDVAVPEEAKTVDATGGYLIPGLWDMHVHTFNNNDPQPPNTWHFPLYLAHGVTGVRDMWVRPGEQAAQVHTWRQELEAGTFVGPRFGAIGTLVDGPPPIQKSDTVTTTVQAQAFVERLKTAHIDFVKVYNRLTPDAYRALVDAAHGAGLYVAGHVPAAISIADASEAEQRSVEHLDGVHYACSSKEDSLRARRVPLSYYLAQEFVDTHDPAQCAALYERLATNETWQVPTFTVFRPWTSQDLAVLADDEGLVYTPVDEATEWQGLRDFLTFAPPPVKQGMADLYALEQRIVREMHAAGVPLLAGTDIGNPYVYPGFSLVDEVKELVEAGLSPLAALQTATLNPARYLRRTDDLGTVETGKLADLVLLGANPLEDVDHLRRIRAVVVNGRLFTQEELERMKHEVLVNNYREALAQPQPLGVQPLEPKVLERFTGVYQQQEGDAEAEVMLQDGELRIRLDDWVDAVEPLGGALFRVRDSNVAYVFHTDAGGVVWGFEVNDGDRIATYRRADR